MFSAEAAKPAEDAPKAEEKKAEPEAAAASTPDLTPEEIKKGQDEWGIKYDDECLKFEKEW